MVDSGRLAITDAHWQRPFLKGIRQEVGQLLDFVKIISNCILWLQSEVTELSMCLIDGTEMSVDSSYPRYCREENRESRLQNLLLS